jgi:hypothetical protein
MIEKLVPKRLQPEDKRIIALTVSAFVCPGAGQCMAGRWLLGVAFAVGFVSSFCAFAILLMWTPLTHARVWLEEVLTGAVQSEVLPFQWKWILISFVSTCVLYGWNLLDVWLQVRRTLKQQGGGQKL